MFAGQTKFIYRVDARKLPALAGGVKYNWRSMDFVSDVGVVLSLSECLYMFL